MTAVKRRKLRRAPAGSGLHFCRISQPLLHNTAPAARKIRKNNSYPSRPQSRLLAHRMTVLRLQISLPYVNASSQAQPLVGAPRTALARKPVLGAVVRFTACDAPIERLCAKHPISGLPCTQRPVAPTAYVSSGLLSAIVSRDAAAAVANIAPKLAAFSGAPRRKKHATTSMTTSAPARRFGRGYQCTACGSFMHFNHPSPQRSSLESLT